MSKKKLILISLVLLSISLLGYKIYKNLHYLTFIQQVENPDKNEIYALFKHDYPFANPNFYVFRFDSKIDPADLNYKSVYNGNLTQAEFSEMMDNVILENYEEDNSKASNPKIKIINNHFLIMERGGYFFALYDLQKNKPIFNECCPFGTWGSQNIWAEKGTYFKGEIKKDEKSDYGIWIEKNMHEPILNYIKEKK